MQEISKNELMSELELTFPKDKVEQMVELYEQFANLDTNVETGIRSLWMENVEDFYGGSGDRAMAHSYLINSESFFKKLLFVVDEEAYNQLNADNKLCLYETMKKLGLFKNVPSGLKIDSGDLSLIASEKTRAAVRAYRLRNKSAHTSERLASSRMLANVNDVISTTIDVVWKNRVIIQNKINKSMVASQVGITTLLRNMRTRQKTVLFISRFCGKARIVTVKTNISVLTLPSLLMKSIFCFRLMRAAVKQPR